jgi:hypothetical protein
LERFAPPDRFAADYPIHRETNAFPMGLSGLHHGRHG